MLVQLTKDSLHDLKRIQNEIKQNNDVALLTEVNELVSKFNKGEVALDDIDKARELNRKFINSLSFEQSLDLLTPPPVCHY
jgi:hypothetical protein